MSPSTSDKYLEITKCTALRRATDVAHVAEMADGRVWARWPTHDESERAMR